MYQFIIIMIKIIINILVIYIKRFPFELKIKLTRAENLDIYVD